VASCSKRSKRSCIDIRILRDVDGIKERITARFERIEPASAAKMMRAPESSRPSERTAPFVGLFGTVWGIMNSFIGISKLHTTNLAVVAPGIAEALLATAFGLAAAIPAVVIYNMFCPLDRPLSRALCRRLRRDSDPGEPRPQSAAGCANRPFDPRRAPCSDANGGVTRWASVSSTVRIAWRHS